MLISDRVELVREKLGNRMDVTNKIPVWIKEAILDLTQSYEFEELAVTGPVSNFTINNAEYDKNAFINSGDTKFTRLLSWFVWYSTTVTVGTSYGFELKYRKPRVVIPQSKILGMPIRWTQVGDKLIIGFMPNLNYAHQQRYQRQHPFSENLTGDKIMMPDDWMDILDMAAALRGAISLRMTDYIALYKNLLYGDPKKRGDLGIISARVSQETRNSSDNERQLQPVVSRYTG